MKFASSHLYTWVERGTVTVRDEHTNHEVTLHFTCPDRLNNSPSLLYQSTHSFSFPTQSLLCNHIWQTPLLFRQGPFIYLSYMLHLNYHKCWFPLWFTFGFIIFEKRVFVYVYCVYILMCLSVIHKFSQSAVLHFVAVDHLNGPLRKQKFTSTGSKGRSCGLWLLDFDHFLFMFS